MQVPLGESGPLTFDPTAIDHEVPVDPSATSLHRGKARQAAANQRRDGTGPAPAVHLRASCFRHQHQHPRPKVRTYRRDGYRIPSVRWSRSGTHALTPNPNCRCHQPPWPVSTGKKTAKSSAKCARRAKFQREKSGKKLREMCPLNTSKGKRPIPHQRKSGQRAGSYPLPALSSLASHTVRKATSEPRRQESLTRPYVAHQA